VYNIILNVHGQIATPLETVTITHK